MHSMMARSGCTSWGSPTRRLGSVSPRGSVHCMASVRPSVSVRSTVGFVSAYCPSRLVVWIVPLEQLQHQDLQEYGGLYGMYDMEFGETNVPYGVLYVACGTVLGDAMSHAMPCCSGCLRGR